MNDARERPRAAGADSDGTIDSNGFEEPDVPHVVVENGDDADLTVSVSVSVVGNSARPIASRYCIAGEKERTVSLRGSADGPLGDVCRIEIDAGIGASAQVSLDPSRFDEGEAPTPRFVVRNGRIAVSGLAAPSERGTASRQGLGLS